MSTYLICPRVHIKKKIENKNLFQILAKLTRSFIEGAYLAHSSPNRFLRVFTVFTHLTLILYAHTNS